MSDVLVIDMVDALPAMRQATTPFRSLLNDILAPAALPPILGLAHRSGAHADLFDPGNRQCAVSRHQGLVIEALEGKQTMSRAAFLAPAWGAASVALLFVTLSGSTARGDEPKLSISGYDPVAYFTDGKPVPGKSDLEYLWHKLRWRFASSEHRDLFSKDPERYAPQYDGYCAMGASIDAAAHKDTVDPEAWAIVDGKLYLVTQQLLAGGMAGTGQGVHKAGRRELAGRRGSAGPDHCRTTLRCLPAHDRGRTARWRALAGRWRAGRARRGRECRRQGRYAGADRAGWQECRCVPQGRRRNRQRYCLYGQPCHGACRIRQIRRSAPALFRPAFAEEHDRPHAAIVRAQTCCCRSRPSRRSSERRRLARTQRPQDCCTAFERVLRSPAAAGNLPPVPASVWSTSKPLP